MLISTPTLEPRIGPVGRRGEGGRGARERAHSKCVSERRSRPTRASAVQSRRLSRASDDPDELALDPDVVVELGRVGRVGRLEPDLVLLLEEALEGDGVLLDLGDDDVAVAGRGLRADEDEVAVGDVGLDHRVAADAEDVRVAARREDVRDGHRLRRVLVGLDRAAGRDLADDRQRRALCGRRLRARARWSGPAGSRPSASAGSRATGRRRARGSPRARGSGGDGGRPTSRPRPTARAISRTDGG